MLQSALHLFQLREALLALPGVGSVTRGQPPRDARLPCVAFSQENDRTLAAYDDAASLRERTYRLRLFAPAMDTLDALADEIDGALTPQGYRLVGAIDSPDGDVKQKTLRYTLCD